MEFVTRKIAHGGFADQRAGTGIGARLTCRKTLGVAAICLCVAAPGTAATFSFENGHVIEGEIIDTTRNTVVIREGIAGMQQLSRRQLKSIRIKTKRGKTISGSLITWRNGLYEIESGGQVVQVRNRRVVAVVPIASEQTVSNAQTIAGEATATDATAPRDTVQQTDTVTRASAAIANAAPVKSPALEPQAIRIVRPRPKPGSEVTPVNAGMVPMNPALVKTASIRAPDPMPTGSQPAGAGKVKIPPVLSISEVKAGENSMEMVFELNLSKPVDQPIMVLYATYDKTAVAGEDYKGERGIVTLPAGASSAQVRVPLIDDTVLEEDETLELFVSADKNLATVETGRTVGTILNDDK